MEVYIQRNYPELPGETVDVLQRGFLSLEVDAARSLAAALNDLVQTPADFLSANKTVLRKGSSVRTRHTSS
jgi:hypothetical protein